MLDWLKGLFRGAAASDPPTGSPGEVATGTPTPRDTGRGGELAAIIARWDSAIAEIAGRFEGVLAQAGAASEAQLTAPELEWEPLTRMWGPVKHHLHLLVEETEAKWETISSELSGLPPPEGVVWREGQKRDAATCELEIRYERANRRAMARAAELLKRRALAARSSHRCTPCGAVLPEVQAVSQCVNVSCPSCGTTNACDPGPVLRLFAASGALFLGQQAAQSAWEAMRRAETRIKSYREKRDVPLDLLVELESAARQYHGTVFAVEAEHVPELRHQVDAKVASHMKSVEKTLRQFWQWRERK